MPDELPILAGDRHQLRILNHLSKGPAVTCYLDVSSPLQATPVVRSDDLPPGMESDRRLDIVHDFHRYIPGDDEVIVYVADYRVALPWPEDMHARFHMHAVDEAGKIENYAAYELRVEQADA